MTHKELVKIAHRWASKNVSCGVVFAELYNSLGECPDVIGFGGWHSVLIECKASRSDFAADRNKSWRQEEGKGMGTYRYYCCPEGMLQLTDLPPKWGLLWVTPKGKIKRVFDPFNEAYHYKNQYKFERNLEAEQQYMYCALRRINVRGGLHLVYSEKQQQSISLDKQAYEHLEIADLPNQEKKVERPADRSDSHAPRYLGGIESGI